MHHSLKVSGKVFHAILGKLYRLDLVTITLNSEMLSAHQCKHPIKDNLYF